MSVCAIVLCDSWYNVQSIPLKAVKKKTLKQQSVTSPTISRVQGHSSAVRKKDRMEFTDKYRDEPQLYEKQDLTLPK